VSRRGQLAVSCAHFLCCDCVNKISGEEIGEQGLSVRRVLRRARVPCPYKAGLGLAFVDADVIDKHFLREAQGGVRRARPVAADGYVNDDEKGMIEDPRATRGPVCGGECRVEMIVQVKANDGGFPLDYVDVKFIGELLSFR
jgi:hypothetical protein